MERSGRKYLIAFSQLLDPDGNKGIIGGLGLGGGIRTLFIPASIISEEERALKSRDQWLVKGETQTQVIALNRITQQTVTVPKRSLLRSLRRATGLAKIDVSDRLDWLVIDKFKDLRIFFSAKDDQRFQKNLQKWRGMALKRQCQLLIPRKVDLGAPGTVHLAYFSQNPAIPAEMWGIFGLKEMDAKILTLWLNSTPHLIQFYLGRTETRGTWMKFDLSFIKECTVLNPSSLSESARKKLLELFDDVSQVQFPNLLEQLKESFEIREIIDQSVLTMIGFDKEKSKRMSKRMMRLLYNDLTRLQELMQMT